MMLYEVPRCHLSLVAPVSQPAKLGTWGWCKYGQSATLHDKSAAAYTLEKR
jgi:hypothetical protein